MYDMKQDAALVDVHDPSAPWIRGYSMLVDQDEAEKIDGFEKPEYRRTAVETWAGHKAFVYVYQKKIPASAKQISDWKLLPKHKGRKRAAKAAGVPA